MPFVLNRIVSLRAVCPAASLVALACLIAAPHAHAQEEGPSQSPRTFAPGVLTTVPSEILPGETASVHPLVEIRSNEQLAWQPEYLASSQTLYEKASHARFTRDIWCLEFSYKPLRLIWVDVPQANGRLEKKLLWYLVYSVRNTGEGLAPAEGEVNEEKAKPTAIDAVQFVPQFVLQGHDQENGRRQYRAYLDKYMPSAMEAIRRREVRGRKLLSTPEMAENPIPPAQDGDDAVWGVAIWEDVDPDLDFFSVYVQGLTNAYRWEDPDGGFQAGDPPGTGRKLVSKTLQLNFYRPGDRFLQHETEVRRGPAPGKAQLYGDGVSEGLVYRWTYR